MTEQVISRLPGAPRAPGPGAGRPSVRMLILGWCTWLLVEWSLRGTQVAVSEMTVRWLVLLAAMGMLGIWPAVRLSQLNSPSGVLIDWAAMNIIWQAVAWPLMPISGWSVEQVAWQSAALASWSLGTGLWIAAGGCSGRGWVRVAAMGVCMLWLLGEPMLMAVLQQHWDMRISPIAALWATTDRVGYFEPQHWAGPILAVGGASIAAWIGFGGFLLGFSHKSR